MCIVESIFVLLTAFAPASAPLQDAQELAKEEYRRVEQAIIGLERTYTEQRRDGRSWKGRMSPRSRSHFTLLQGAPPAASKNSAKIDLTRCSIDGRYVANSLVVYFKAEDGSEYKDTFTISGGSGINGPSVTAVRATLKVSLEMTGWTVTTEGDAIITIVGHTDKGQAMSPITQVGAKNNLVEAYQPQLILSGGVRAVAIPK